MPEKTSSPKVLAALELDWAVVAQRVEKMVRIFQSLCQSETVAFVAASSTSFELAQRDSHAQQLAAHHVGVSLVPRTWH